MRPITLIPIVFLAVLASVHSQGWVQKAPDWRPVEITGILSGMDDVLYASGHNTTLLESTNLGVSWEPLALPLSYMNITSIDVQGENLYLAAQSFHHHFDIYPTAGDSLLHIYKYNTVTKMLTDLSMVRKKPAHYLVYPGIRPPQVQCSGQYIYLSEDAGNDEWLLRKSNDGGLHWEERSAPGKLLSFDAVDDMLLVSAVVPPKADFIRINRSTDAGESWHSVFEVSTPPAFDRIPIVHSRTKDDTLIAIGAVGGIIVSRDAGATWKMLYTIPWNSHAHSMINALFIDSTERIIVVGRVSDVYISDNGGSNWVQSKGSDPYQTVASRAATSIHAGQGSIQIGNKEGHFYRTSNDGITWETVRLSEMRDIQLLHFFDRSSGLIGAVDKDNTFHYYLSSDGGDTWSRRGKRSSHRFHVIPENSLLQDIHGYDIELIGDSTHVQFYRSVDGTLTWEKTERHVFPLHGLSEIYAVNGLYLFASSSESEPVKVWYSVNQGATWNSSSINYISYPNAIRFSLTLNDHGNIVVYCYDLNAKQAAVYRSADSCKTWNDTKFFSDSMFYRIVDFQPDSDGSMFCRVIWRDTNSMQSRIEEYFSENEGATWEYIRETEVVGRLGVRPVYMRRSLYDFYAPFKITKRENPWVEENIQLWENLYNNLTCYYFLDDSFGWLASGPTIFRTTDGGTSWTELPFTVREDAAITAIYPNPVMAGQHTTIDIAVGTQRAVSAVDNGAGVDNTGDRRSPLHIAIYDLLGRTVATLYNGPADPGTRTLTWQPAPTLPAGMYVARMSLGEKVWAKQVAVLR